MNIYALTAIFLAARTAYSTEFQEFDLEDYGYTPGIWSTYSQAYNSALLAATEWSAEQKFDCDPSGMLSALQWVLDIFWATADVTEFIANGIRYLVFPTGAAIEVVEPNNMLHDFRISTLETVVDPWVSEYDWVSLNIGIAPVKLRAIRRRLVSVIFVPESEHWPYWDPITNQFKYGTAFEPERKYGDIEAGLDVTRVLMLGVIIKILRDLKLWQNITNLMTVIYRTAVEKHWRGKVMDTLDALAVDITGVENEVNQNEEKLNTIIKHTRGAYV